MMNASVHDMGHLRWKAARWKPTGHEGCCRPVSALEASGAYKSGWGGGRRDSPFESQAQAAKSGIENTIRPLVVPDLHQHASIARARRQIELLSQESKCVGCHLNRILTKLSTT